MSDDAWEYRCHVINVLNRHLISRWTDDETASAMLHHHDADDLDAWLERRKKPGPIERVDGKGRGTTDD